MSVSIITNRNCLQTFDWYQHWWPWMTLNGVLASILHYFTEFDSFVGRLRHSGWRWTYNVRKISYPSYIWPKLTHTAVARSLCNSYAYCFFYYHRNIVLNYGFVAFLQKLQLHIVMFWHCFFVLSCLHFILYSNRSSWFSLLYIRVIMSVTLLCIWCKSWECHVASVWTVFLTMTADHYW